MCVRRGVHVTAIAVLGLGLVAVPRPGVMSVKSNIRFPTGVSVLLCNIRAVGHACLNVVVSPKSTAGGVGCCVVTVPKLCCSVPAMAEEVRINVYMNADRATIPTLAVTTIMIAQVFLFEWSDI